MANAQVLMFYSPKKELGELSNFYAAKLPIMSDGNIFATSEHLFQFQKFHYPGASEASLAYAEIIRTASTPGKAKILATQKPVRRFAWQKALTEIIVEYQARGVKLRPDWEAVKIEVMRQCLFNKFVQDAHCREVLLSTRDFELVEASPKDSFWGIGSDGKGQNWLGKLLCELRTLLID